MPQDSIIINGVKLSLIQGDITSQETEAIVNAANPSLMGGGGVDGAIHRAGGPAILAECKKIVAKIGRLSPGKAVITTGGNLKARHVIHTVGPIWHGGNRNEAETLASAYRESLRLAAEKQIKSISFPSISTGVYGYPVEEAAKIALDTTVSFAREKVSSIREINFVLFDSSTYKSYLSALEQIAKKTNKT